MAQTWSPEIADLNRAYRLKSNRTSSISINAERFGQFMNQLLEERLDHGEAFGRLESIVGEYTTIACREIAE